MKRQISFVGRIGAIAVAIGLALLLASFIPPNVTSTFTSSESVAPESFQFLGSNSPIGLLLPGNGSFHISFFRTLTSQQELKIDYAANGTLCIYMLEMDYQEVTEKLPSRDLALLQEFVSTNSSVIGLQQEGASGLIDYIPNKYAVNATLAFANPSSDTIHVSYDGNVSSIFASPSKTRTLASWITPVGCLLMLPWLSMWLSQKRKRNKEVAVS
ncbi:MAG: hypothetical protein NWF05_02450 [Candidatus Bathyarchaeota archaeon]|nr:hypothetical protein [Candidatus Bathyarchaeota archaeon]